jgi:hypothetical protein
LGGLRPPGQTCAEQRHNDERRSNPDGDDGVSVERVEHGAL